jgi:hypothetical protein
MGGTSLISILSKRKTVVGWQNRQRLYFLSSAVAMTNCLSLLLAYAAQRGNFVVFQQLIPYGNG